MNYKLPIQVKKSNLIVTPIIDEIQESKFNIVNVYVEKPNPEVSNWILILEDSNGERFRYNLIFS
jgi:hypothetical protein